MIHKKTHDQRKVSRAFALSGVWRKFQMSNVKTL
jgi:hypothetical protein